MGGETLGVLDTSVNFTSKPQWIVQVRRLLETGVCLGPMRPRFWISSDVEVLIASDAPSMARSKGNGKYYSSVLLQCDQRSVVRVLEDMGVIMVPVGRWVSARTRVLYQVPMYATVWA